MRARLSRCFSISRSTRAMPCLMGGELIIETESVHVDGRCVRKQTAIPAGEYILIAVTDSGQGIAPEHLPRIFEPFYTTKSEDKGTGLGLAMVDGIVRQSGGFIWVDSSPGVGSTFKIYFPVAECTEHEVPSLSPRKWRYRVAPRPCSWSRTKMPFENRVSSFFPRLDTKSSPRPTERKPWTGLETMLANRSCDYGRGYATHGRTQAR